VWNDYLGSDRIAVTTRIGDQEAETKRWSLSTDNSATFYPGNDTDFIRAMFAGDRLVAQTTPYNESPVTAVFNTTGLETAITDLRKTCGW
jgi:type VI secretion system protein VasI